MRTGLTEKASGQAGSSPLSLEMVDIVKSYGAVKVLHGVDLSVRKGTIHALLGANGAGKSTLLKIAMGATAASGGRELVDGRELRFASPLEARQAGIGMVFQERSLIPALSTVDNIFLNGEIRRFGLVDQRAQRRETRRIFQQLGVGISPMVACGELGIADQQMVEIAKAMRLATKVLILDEPTAALTAREVERLFAVVRQIARTGVGIVYVSHRLAEVFELCEDVTILRDGRVVLSKPVSVTTMDEVVEAIAGGGVTGAVRPSSAAEPRDKPPVLAVSGLQLASKLRAIAFEVRSGEVLGVAGLAGSGRSTLLKALFGIRAPDAGRIEVCGRRVKPASPRKAIRNGIYLIPEDRKTQGLVLSHSVSSNLLLSILKRLCVGPLIDRRRGEHVARQSIAKFRVRPADPDKAAESLSGGNQQKVVLAKAFNAGGRLLLLDEPTFGVDIHSRAEIRDRIREFVEAGNGALWVTSDLRELCDVSDRILVLVDGQVLDILSNRPQHSESQITHLIQGTGKQ